MKTKIRQFAPYLLLLVLILVTYYPITLFMYSFKWDMIDQFFPIRYLISEHIQAGQLPLWNPYQNGGYPLHADPQSGAWYLPVWILSLLPGGYTVYSLHIEFLLTIYIAAIGFFKLSQFLEQSRYTSFVLAYMYCCCGFFIGNAQHLTWLISGAFLPFAILYYLKTLQTQKLSNALKTSIVLSFMLMGGYPGFLIILTYLFLYFFMAYAIPFLLQKEYLVLIKIFSLQLTTLVVAILISAIMVYSIVEFIPLITRGEAVSIDKALWGAFTMPSFLSFLYPFATAQHSEILGTDISMANAYMGIIGLIFFVAFIFYQKKTKLDNILLYMAIVAFLLSIGNITPIRALAYRYLPMMDIFRHPSIFRLFFMLPFLLLAGNALDFFLKNPQRTHRIKSLLVVMISFSIIILVIAFNKNYSGTDAIDYFFRYSFFKTNSTIYDHIIVQGFIQLALLCILLIALLKFNPQNFKVFLAGFIVIDMFIAVNFNLSYTAVDRDNSPTQLYTMLDKEAKGFVLPIDSIEKNNDNIKTLKPLWKNLSLFKKEIAYDGWNAFILRSYTTLEKSVLFSYSKKNPPSFFASDLKNIDNSIDTTQLTNSSAFVSPYEYRMLSSVKFDSIQTDKLTITGFHGNEIEMSSLTSQDRLIVLFQNKTPGWKAYVNGKESSLMTANYSLMAIPVKQGVSTIRLVYEPIYTIIYLFVSIISLLLAVCYIIIDTYSSPQSSYKQMLNRKE